LGADPFGPGTRTPTQWFNGNAFVVAPRGQYGSGGRNILDGPGLVNIDMGLMKNFPITEKIRAQLRAEFFNLANHPNFQPPNSTVNTTAVGIVSATNTDSRQIQFGLRLDF
jgi:hypothetical protein